MFNEDNLYKQKYLKYKAKYHAQKGGTLESGYGVIFTSKINAIKLRAAMNSGIINNKNDIAKLLDKEAYIVFDGKQSAELLENTSRILNEQVRSVSNTMANVAALTSFVAATASQAQNITPNKAAQLVTGIVADKVAHTGAKIIAANATEINANISKAQNIVANTSAIISTVNKAGKIQLGGADLPKTINTLENKPYDRVNQLQLNYLKNAIATQLGLKQTDIDVVTIKFKLTEKPELK